MNHEQATRGVVTVGDGRGFIVEGKFHRLVITAAHCLPYFPPCSSISSTGERTYEKLLGPLGKSPSIWAECLFVDPVGDIAVLSAVDNQEWSEQADAYEVLMDAMTPLPIAHAPDDGAAWLLSLQGKWFTCRVKYPDRALWLSDAIEGIMGGMSGSPILAENGQAIGVCVAGGGHLGEKLTEGGPNPTLADGLPGWCLREIGKFTNGDAPV